ncbi:GntR family transcriptional regulator [Amylibacter ulvae]|uniref:Pyruvate dehydrogenase complex repressor n=1 Tax=Paramylibacter ulvae TaxID=1651968 RepID=A0ABQ3D414_9RHOB|nr:FCD domain-containing protein [Amylibacter ulvae]GHA57644.1 GntR family transcriptional regulator [Amylibacter ulvae]
MPFQPIAQERVASAVVHQIEQLILRGLLRPGERLPAERLLSEKLGVSRPSLREAIATLQESGLLTSKANSGIYVADILGNVFSPPLINLFASHKEAFFDYIALRRDLEGMAAERAAMHGTKNDHLVIQSIFEQMQTAHDQNDPERDAELDANFHMSITEASHNVMLLHMMRSMFDMLKTGVFYNRKVMFEMDTTRVHLLNQHRDIMQAIVDRKPDAARRAVEAHLTYVHDCLKQNETMQSHDDIAKLRLETTRTRT